MLRSLLAAATLVLALHHGAAAAEREVLLIETRTGTVVIELLPEIAPRHVERIKTLASQGAYDGVAFHRVLSEFMAQTGDVQYGKVQEDGTISEYAGAGDSGLPDLPAEFSGVHFERGIVGMARGKDPNSANSQFFIMTDAGGHLDGKYTVWGRVVSGMEHVDNIKQGPRPTGVVAKPDRMIKVTLGKAEIESEAERIAREEEERAKEEAARKEAEAAAAAAQQQQDGQSGTSSDGQSGETQSGDGEQKPAEGDQSTDGTSQSN